MFGFSNLDGMDLSDPTVARAQKRVGGWLREKWRLDELIGVGGMAAVYAATHRNGSRGAIKMLHLELSMDAEIRQRFLREGYVANAVEHPSVVRALDDDVAEDGSVFLVMELLDGESLEARWLRKGQRLEAAEVLCALDPVLSVLAAAHARGIVHRDIKPENLFINRDGTIKLLDFGIARLRKGAGKLTQTGVTMGTPAFMAPEQALGQSERIGPPSDLWAVGATLFSLLSGRHVHLAATPNAQVIAAATRPAPSLASVLPSVHPSLAYLVDKALRFDPAERWPDALAMQQALRETYHQILGSPVQTAPRLQVPEVNAPVEPQSNEPTEEEDAVTRVHSPQVFSAGIKAFSSKTVPVEPPPQEASSMIPVPRGVARTTPMAPSISALVEPSGSRPSLVPEALRGAPDVVPQPETPRWLLLLVGGIVVLALLVGILLVKTLLERAGSTPVQ
jgi:serine/threonine protein kinase